MESKDIISYFSNRNTVTGDIIYLYHICIQTTQRHKLPNVHFLHLGKEVDRLSHPIMNNMAQLYYNYTGNVVQMFLT